MSEPSSSLTTQKLAVGGMTCVNCEILVQHTFKQVPGVEARPRRSRARQCRGRSPGDLDIAALQRAVAEDGYLVALGRSAEVARTEYARGLCGDRGIFAVMSAADLALQHLGSCRAALPLGDNELGLVFLIGLVASVSSCMAVTGGLLVAARPPYNEARRPHELRALQAPSLFQCGADYLLRAPGRRGWRAGFGADALRTATAS